ncbi:MAG: hypothetical protein ACOCUV_01380 [bacterium]
MYNNKLRFFFFLSATLHIIAFVIIFHLYNRTIINEALYEEAKYHIVVGKYPKIDDNGLLCETNSIILGNESNKNKLTVFITSDCYYCKKFLGNHLDYLYSNYVSNNKLSIELNFTGYLKDSRQQELFLFNLFNKSDDIGRLEVINSFLKTGLEQKTNFDFFERKKQIENNRNIAYDLDIYQFPTFILNERKIIGLLSLKDFSKLLDVEFAHSKDI